MPAMNEDPFLLAAQNGTSHGFEALPGGDNVSEPPSNGCVELEALVHGQRTVDDRLMQLAASQAKILDTVTNIRREVLEVSLVISRGLPEKHHSGNNMLAANSANSPKRSPFQDAFIKRVSVSLDALAKQTSASSDNDKSHGKVQKKTRIRDSELKAVDSCCVVETAEFALASSKDMHLFRSRSDGMSNRPSSSSSEASEELFAAGFPSDWPSSIIIRDFLNVARPHKELADLISKRGAKAGKMVDVSQIRRSSIYAEIQTSLEASARISDKRSPSIHQDFSMNSGLSRLIAMPVARCMIKPSHWFRLAMDALSILALAFDMFTIPFMLAWDAKNQGTLNLTMWITCFFWTSDILLTFRTGYFDHGDLEMKPKKVACNYLKTWLVPDLALVACDWVNIIIGLVAEESVSSSKGLTLLRFLKAGRLLRLVGVVRLAKLAELFERISSMASLDTHSVVVQIPQLIIVVVWVNHILGCTWFAIGRLAPSDTGDRWLDSFTGVPGADSSKTYIESEITYQYLTAFHWSLTQMTPGSMQIAAYNSWERAFTSSCLMLGILFFGSIISAVTAKMTQYRMMRQEKTTKVVALRRFFRQHFVSKDLTVAIQKQVVQRLAKPSLLTFSEVYAFSLLSMRLRAELQYELCRPSFQHHPLFLLCDKVDSVAMRHLIRKVFNQVVLSSGDNLFLAGSEAENAYVLWLGELTYVQEPESSKVTKVTMPQKVAAGSWLSEAALWCHWVHVGIVEAKSTAEILVINAEASLHALMQHHVMWQVTQAYGKAFHKLLLESAQHEVWPSDLRVPFECPEQVFTYLTPEVKTFIGLFAIDTLQKSMWTMMKSIGFVQLEEEVRNLKCILMFDVETGQVERVVSVTVVKLVHEGNIFVQLGKYKDGEIEVDCELPGTKQEGNEATHSALIRVLNGQMKPFASTLEGKSFTHRVYARNSKSYSIFTKYMHTEHHRTLKSACSLPCYKAQLDLISKSTMSSHVRSLVMSQFSSLSPPSDQRLTQMNSQVEARMSIPGNDVMAVTSNGVTYLYSWLSKTDFEFFSTRGSDVVRNWLRSLNLDEEGTLREPDGYWHYSGVANPSRPRSTPKTFELPLESPSPPVTTTPLSESVARATLGCGVAVLL